MKRAFDELCRHRSVIVAETPSLRNAYTEDKRYKQFIVSTFKLLSLWAVMHVFYTPHIDRSHELPEEEAWHCLRVLRLEPGDEIMLTDGRGSFYRAEIALSTGKKCSFNVLETLPQPPLHPCRLHLALAPTKNMDRMEWLAEKATELGIDELSFLDCRHSERRQLKLERIEKIVVSAVKQSLKARVPVLNEMTDFKQFVKHPFSGQKFIAHCHEGTKPLLQHALLPGQDALVLIGPEGDFSAEEVALATDHGFQAVSLGASRLRTETAALAAGHILCLFNQSPVQ